MRLLRRDERVLLMRAAAGAVPVLPFRPQSGEEHAIRVSVASAAAMAGEFRNPSWRLVVNSRERAIFAVAPGIYPDLVALDGSEAGVAWVMEVASPMTLADGAAWERWTQLAATGLSFILTVPYGCRRLAREISDSLGLKVGLIYEYGITPEGVIFPAKHEIRRHP